MATLIKLIRKNRNKITNSTFIGLLITLVLGAWENTSMRIADIRYYGFPFTWITEHIEKTSKLNYNHYALLGNWFIFNIIVLIIILSYQYIKNYINKKRMKGYAGNAKHEHRKNKNWENNSAYVKYKQ